MKIRRVEKTSEDFTRLVDFLVENFAKEHEMGTLSAKNFEFDKGLLSVVKAVECAAWIAEKDGEIIGSLGIHETSPWYTSKPYFADLWFYVLPEYRNTHIGTLLVMEAKQFSQYMELPLMIGIFNIDDVEGKIKAFERMGMKLASAAFIAGE